MAYDVKAAALSKLTADGEKVWRDQAMELIADMCKRWGKTDTRVSRVLHAKDGLMWLHEMDQG